MMERDKVVDIIANLERKYPVQEWRYRGMDLWPLIKRDLFFTWYHSQNNPKQNDKKGRSGLKEKIFSVVQSLFNFVKLYFQPKVEVDTITSGSQFHRVKYNGQFINRYYFPLIQSGEISKFIHIEYGGKKNKLIKYNNEDRTIFLDDYLPFMKLFGRLFGNVKINLTQFDQFLDDVKIKLNLNMNSYEMKLQQEIQDILDCSHIFSFVLRKYSPKEVLGLCYYNIPMFSLHYNCNRMNINNFDVQHGGQGPLHVMYNFSKIKEEGYNLLPKTFWCWDDTSLRGLRSWLKDQKFHDSEKKGNPWVSYQVENSNSSYIFPEAKIILYTVQEPFLEDYLIKAIRFSPSEYQWWLRLHPRTFDKKEALIEVLTNEAIYERVEIDKACQYPLPVLLKNCSVHISKYSGSIIEAALLNVKSIIIDRIGVESYADYIGDGKAVECLEEDNVVLLNLILLLTNR